MATVLDVTLVRTPGVCGGNLRIDGTRMTVNEIVTLHKQGLAAEQIVEQYPHRTLRETMPCWRGITSTRPNLTKSLPPKRPRTK